MIPVERALAEQLDGVKQSISDGAHLLKKARNIVETLAVGGDTEAQELLTEIDEWLYIEEE